MLHPSFRLVVVVAAAMCAVQAINLISGYALNDFGILPRSLQGLWGIFTAPFLHASIAHLISNLAPFVVLGWFVAGTSRARFLGVSALIIVLGGLLVWIFGRTALHVGASGWVFGLWAYLLARGWIDRSFQSIAVSLLVLVGYGGMVFGLLPAQGTSFESHIAGAVAGAIAALVFARR